MAVINKRIEDVVQKTENFLSTYNKGEVFHIYISTPEKEYLVEYLKHHPIGKKFHIKAGVSKSGDIVHDYYLEEK